MRKPVGVPAGSLVLLSFLLHGCAVTHRDFMPVESVDAESRDGHPAAQYELGRDNRWGEVRVWSDGVTRFDKDPAQTLLHIGIEVENALDTPLSLDLDQTRLTEAEVDDAEVGELAPFDATGLLETPPHSVRRFEIEFELPEGVMPVDVERFQVRWNLIGPEGWRYEQHTGFKREPLRGATPYYGYGWSPWVVGFGWGWGSYWWCY